MIIKHNIAFYFLNGHEDFYKGKQNGSGTYVRQASIARLFKNMHLPYTVHYIDADIATITIQDLGVASADLNIVFLPTDVSICKLLVQSDKIFLFVSFPSTSYKCKGARTYYSFIKRIRKMLCHNHQYSLFMEYRSRKKDRNISGLLRNIVDLACMLDIADFRMFDILLKMIRSDASKPKNVRIQLYHLILLKKKLFFKYATLKDLKKRHINFRFNGIKYTSSRRYYVEYPHH